jgi:protein-S-isoprenylcysteine O-methyltransferase Ste14
MEPYFYTSHIAGLLLLTTTGAWTMMEAAQRSQPPRQAAIKIGGIRSQLAALGFLIASIAVLNLAPRAVPGATIRPGAAAFAAGLVILLAGLVLRGWAFKTLGQYFTHTVMVSADQPVIARGPYRVLRHPSYTGLLLAAAGVGLAAANWAGLGGVLLLTLTPLLWRIHTEETALLATLGGRYRGYAAQHKRLVPLVW